MAAEGFITVVPPLPQLPQGAYRTSCGTEKCKKDDVSVYTVPCQDGEKLSNYAACAPRALYEQLKSAPQLIIDTRAAETGLANHKNPKYTRPSCGQPCPSGTKEVSHVPCFSVTNATKMLKQYSCSTEGTKTTDVKGDYYDHERDNAPTKPRLGLLILTIAIVLIVISVVVVVVAVILSRTADNTKRVRRDFLD